MKDGVLSSVTAVRNQSRSPNPESLTENTLMATQTQQVGKIVQIIGPVVDVEFEAGHLPEIYNALSIKSEGTAAGVIDIVAEVEQHLGENRVRAVAMKPTDSLQRGMNAVDLGGPQTLPVGPRKRGPVRNLLWG